MSRVKIALLVTTLLVLVVSVAAFAGGFKVVKYEDTSSKITNPATAVTKPQYIANGDFTQWDGQFPKYWKVPWPPVLTPGWSVHFANVDLTAAGTKEGGVEPGAPGEETPPIGYNRGTGYFFRTGAKGSQYAGMSQQVDPALVDGTYWVQVHITAWHHNVTSAYNSVAWYGFGTSDDHTSVSEWRELFPDTVVCGNEGICNYLARKESVSIKHGEYMHLRMGMKFPDHNAWTVFVVDDISVSDFSDGTKIDVTDFIDDGDILWDPRAER